MNNKKIAHETCVEVHLHTPSNMTTRVLSWGVFKFYMVLATALMLLCSGKIGSI